MQRFRRLYCQHEKTMRYALITIFILSLTFIACKKDQTENSSLIGTWRWVKQYSGGGPVYDQTPQSTGINEKVFYNSNKTWSLEQNGTKIKSGTFTTSIITNTRNEKINKITYHINGRDSIDYFEIIQNNTLRFSNDLTGSVGSGSRFYERE